MRLLTFFKNLALGIKLNLVVVVALGSLLTALLVVTGRSVNSLSTRTGQQRVEQEAGVIRSRLGEARQEVVAAAGILAVRPGLVNATANRDVKRLTANVAVGAAPLELDDVDVVDADGARLTVIVKAGETYDADQEDALLLLALLGIDATGIIIEEEEEGWELRLAAAVPIRDTSGAIVGGLLASRAVDDEFLKEINFSRTDQIHLALIYDGQILAQDFPDPVELETFSADLLEESAVGQALSGQTLIADDLVYDSHGASHILAYTPLSGGGETHAVIGIVVSQAELFVFQRQLTTTMTLVFALLGLAAVLAVVLFVWRNISVPINNLRSVAERMARGDLGQRAEVTTRDEIGQLARAFNSMSEQLRELISSLEARTRSLETSAQVSHRLSTILDRKQLVAEVVEQVQEAFDYYHAHIYLLDEASQELVMAGGTGEAGRTMLAGGHKIPWGKGLVGRAAETRAVVLVPDVSREAGWLPNPLLPDTRSEIAVPIVAGERVLGVLDVQHDLVGGLGHDDADLLSSIAGQVAVALQNTRLFAETRQRAEYEARLNLINQNIQRATSLEGLLQVAARELGGALGAQRVSVQLAPSADGDHLPQS